ncbi:MAG: tetratricopeptide repeat protein [Gammaproteobacteria bacterium]|nr:tetratricopeptide repeat protein [Gammaproteobacteria bacterium]MDH3767856.1 tetratricopeptide repeat protein [Gammaproteobacteria bacterium]
MTPATELSGLPVALAATLFISGCAGTVVTPTANETSQEIIPFETDGGEASYHLLLAEMALERDQFDAAAREYRMAAQLSDDAEVAQRAVTLSFGLGRNTEALASAQRWVELDPGNLEARRYLASIYLQNKELDLAVGELDTMLNLYSDVPEEAFLALTGMLLEQRDQAISMRAMDRLLAQYPDVPAAHYGMALMSMQVGDYDSAQRHVTTSEELRPDWPRAGLLHARILVARGDEEAGLERAANLARDATDPTLRLDYALLLANLNREGEARLELDLLLDEHPRMAGALRAAGLLEMRRGDLDAAQLHFTSLLATGRGTWEAFYYLGSIAEQRAQAGRAIRFYSQVRDGDLAITAQARAASLYESMGEIDRAVEHLTTFANETPKLDADLHTAAAELLARNNEVDRALEILNETLIRHPKNRGARFARAFLYEQMDQVDTSIAELRALLKDAPEDSIALNALGYTLVDRTDRYREGYRLIRKALELDPNNPAIIDSMGWAEYRRGDLEEAHRHLERAYGLVRDPEIAAHLGEVLYLKGQTDDALTIWQESLAENPGADVLLEVMQKFGP